MKHANPAALDHLEPLLQELRKIAGLKERARGVFYRSGRAFLHFHEDGAVFYADLRIGAEFRRIAATTASQQAFLLESLRRTLSL